MPKPSDMRDRVIISQRSGLSWLCTEVENRLSTPSRRKTQSKWMMFRLYYTYNLSQCHGYSVCISTWLIPSAWQEQTVTFPRTVSGSRLQSRGRLFPKREACQKFSFHLQVLLVQRIALVSLRWGTPPGVKSSSKTTCRNFIYAKRQFPHKSIQPNLPSTDDPSSPLSWATSGIVSSREAKRIQKLKTTFPIFHSAAVTQETQVAWLILSVTFLMQEHQPLRFGFYCCALPPQANQKSQILTNFILWGF